MSNSISSSVSNVLAGNIATSNTGPSVQTANDQQAAIQQDLAQASLAGIYGPPYILDVSLAYAVGNTPLSTSPPIPPVAANAPVAATASNTPTAGVNVTA